MISPAAGQAGSPIFGDLQKDYIVDHWQTDDGLPQNSITAIAQDTNGYLWLGTFNGLVRFDGVRFVVFNNRNNPALANNRIVTLFVHHDALWMADEEGAAICHRKGKFTRFTRKDGLPPRGVQDFYTDPEDNLWFTSHDNAGSFRFENGKFVRRLPPTPGGGGSMSSVTFDSAGSFWAVQGKDIVHVTGFTNDFVSTTEIVRYRYNFEQSGLLVPVSESKIKPMGGLALAPARAGGFWIASRTGLAKFRAGQCLAKFAATTDSLAGLLEDSQGCIWAGTYRAGLYRLTPQGTVERFRLSEDSPGEQIRALAEDVEGNIWAGTDGEGLFRFRRRFFSTYGINDGLTSKVVKSVSEGKDGTLYVCTLGHVDVFATGSVSTNGGRPAFARQKHYDLMGAWCGLVDRGGRFWLGTFGRGVFALEDDNFVKLPIVGTNGNYFSGQSVVQSLLQDREGKLWCGTEQGLFCVSNQIMQQVDFPAGVASDVTALAADTRNNLYVATEDGCLWRGFQGNWVQYSRHDGLPGDQITSIVADSNDTLWLGTASSGLWRGAAGKFSAFPVGNDGFPSTILSIIEDAHQDFWLGSEHGIFLASRQELNDFANGKTNSYHCMRFDKSDGLGNSECAAMPSASCQGPDGRLWFATLGGISVVEPARMKPNNLPPPVLIEEADIDWNPTAILGGGIVVPPGGHDVEIKFTGLSLASPNKMQFKYKLDGMPGEWRYADARSRAVQFSSLAPGKYAFRVTACNNDGVWNETGAALQLVLQPRYWQTWWFRALVVVAAAGTFVSASILRMNQLKRAHAAQSEFSRQLINAEEAERKRIAGELHDSLGQELLIIQNRAILALMESNAPPPMVEHLREISNGAANAIEEVRATAFRLRPVELDKLGLTRAAEAMIQKAAAASGIKFSMELEEVRGSLTSEKEIGIYRILQEAINNIMKHSQAKSVIVELRREPPVLRLSLLDDGVGFDPQAQDQSAVPSGFGLKGIAQRCKLMGGDFQVLSAAGKGTRLTVSVPLRN